MVKMHWMRVYHLIIIAILILFPAISVAAISVTVDRNVIEEGETFQLTIMADEGDPDTSAISHDFNILGTAKSSKVSIINGSVKSMNELILRLSPKTTGSLVIPAIRSGNDISAPIRMTVNQPSFDQAAQGADIFLESKVDLETAYVQSQIIYTVRLYRAVEIREGSLTEPDLSDAVIERLGEDVTFQTRRDGRLYHVTERRFAIFPQKSGSFTIAPTVFQGQAIDASTRQRTNDPFDRFFQNQRTKRVRIKSDFIHLTVMPEPSAAEGEAWLPAKRLMLMEKWSPESPQFKVGEPVTLTLRMEAEGLTAAQLPELTLDKAAGIKQYTDQPVVETVLKRGNIVGIREEKFAIVPTESGQLVLPEVRLYWWNTEMNQQEMISIPSKVIDVLPGENTAIETMQKFQKPMEASDHIAAASPDILTKETLITVVEAGYWPFVAAGGIFAWLVTAMGWFVYWRNHRGLTAQSREEQITKDLISLKAATQKLKKACKDNDASRAKEAINQWAKAAWPNEEALGVTALTKRRKDKKLYDILQKLNQHLYAEGNSTWQGAEFWGIVKPHLIVDNDSIKGDESLPGLYPQA